MPTATKWSAWGRKCCRPTSKPDADGEPLFRLPGRRAATALPGLCAGAYLGRVTELILKESHTPIHLERVYETDMAEGLKAMALEGHGVAFLPTVR